MSALAGVTLHLNNVGKKYGSLQVLKNIQLQVEPGEFVVIIGKSGCGKSTLLKQIAGLEHTTTGVITQNEEKVIQLNDEARVMFQDDRLLPWLSVIHNVGVGLSLEKGWKDKAILALKQVGLEDKANEWPAKLSGGQKQRVALARALAAEPKLLLLDEPLGALDALTRQEMQQLVEQLWEKHQFTTLLVTHDVSEAVALADRVILLENGEIKLNVSIPLVRPRQRSSIEFAQFEEQLMNSVLQQNDKNPTARQVG